MLSGVRGMDRSGVVEGCVTDSTMTDIAVLPLSFPNKHSVAHVAREGSSANRYTVFASSLYGK